jgi:pimeloyl-ACP methyl ester carboxylesterase
MVCVAISGAYVGAEAKSATAVHRIESDAIAGNMMGFSTTRRVLVYTPEGYDRTRRHYPVIYWIPGWETPASSEYVGALDSAIAKNWIPPVITVTVDVREGVLMLNSPVFGNWADFLIEEVVPFIDAEYRTIRSPKGRALMGHSTGGYAAMLLPLLYPGIWSAVGLNDASVWGACRSGFGPTPIEDFSEYESLPGSKKAWIQVGIATSPNMDSPRFFDVPGLAGPEVTAAWASRCLSNEDMLRGRLHKLSQLAMIGLAVPRAEKATNRSHNLKMVDAIKAVGADPWMLNVEGTHGSHRSDRFIFLAGLVTSVMDEASFDLSGSRAETWGSLKDAHAVTAVVPGGP